MITDFSTYTSAGLQNITYHGVNSLTGLGIVLAEGTKTSELESKSVTEEIPYTDGHIDISDIYGTKYEPKTLIYRFKIFAENRAELKTKESAVKSWLNSAGNREIIDSDYLETVEGTPPTTVQWIFQNCFLKSIEIEEGDKVSDCEYEYLTATFQCAPRMRKQGEVNTRVLKFTDVITGNDTATIAVTTSGYTVTKHDGTTATGSLPTGARKYRLVAYCENDPTITLGNDTITPETVFDLPDSGTITISGGGYGYFELWHDTRTGVRL